MYRRVGETLRHLPEGILQPASIFFVFNKCALEFKRALHTAAHTQQLTHSSSHTAPYTLLQGFINIQRILLDIKRVYFKFKQLD